MDYVIVIVVRYNFLYFRRNSSLVLFLWCFQCSCGCRVISRYLTAVLKSKEFVFHKWLNLALSKNTFRFISLCKLSTNQPNDIFSPRTTIRMALKVLIPNSLWLTIPYVIRSIISIYIHLRANFSTFSVFCMFKHLL